MSDSRPIVPVSDSDIAAAKEQLKTLDMADLEIQKAERAGLDMTEQKKNARELRVKLQQIIQTYAPGR